MRKTPFAQICPLYVCGRFKRDIVSVAKQIAKFAVIRAGIVIPGGQSVGPCRGVTARLYFPPLSTLYGVLAKYIFQWLVFAAVSGGVFCPVAAYALKIGVVGCAANNTKIRVYYAPIVYGGHNAAAPFIRQEPSKTIVFLLTYPTVLPAYQTDAGFRG